MSIPIQGKDGKFKGSIGAGRTNIPTASTASPVAGVAYEDLVKTSRSRAELLPLEYEDPKAAVQKVLSRYTSAKLMTSAVSRDPYTPAGWGSNTMGDGTRPERLIVFPVGRAVILYFSGDTVTQAMIFEDTYGYVTINVDSNGEPHNTDKGEPAVSGSHGGDIYFKHGELHRVGGPARRLPDTTLLWAREGKIEAYLDRDGTVHDSTGTAVKGWQKMKLQLRCKGLRTESKSRAR